MDGQMLSQSKLSIPKVILKIPVIFKFQNIHSIVQCDKNHSHFTPEKIIKMGGKNKIKVDPGLEITQISVIIFSKVLHV